jgi:capsular polysaccharide biosynthesis protein
MVYARGQLRDAMDKYAALRTQIQTAQIDLETAQAAFKYRYSVVTPAHLPRSPTKPNVPLVILAAFVAAVLCGLLFAVLADVRKGRLLERWQIERLLDRPILGEIALPRLEAPGFE